MEFKNSFPIFHFCSHKKYYGNNVWAIGHERLRDKLGFEVSREKSLKKAFQQFIWESDQHAIEI